jgi:5-methyltetrahydrofolate--homocysteine methyltransferase
MSLETIYDAVLTGNAKKAEAEVRIALAENVSAEDILQKACIPAMSEVGRQFEVGKKFIPEMLISARAMQTAVSVLKPLLVQEDVKPVGKVILGTVKGDLHDIGKKLVGMLLEGAGFQIIDLGTDVTPDKFVNALRESDAQIVALSALLTTTMPSMRNTIEALKEAGLRERVKVLVGGAPVTETFALEIGADGFAPDASAGARLAREWMDGN